jgi:hypothetical protein
MPHEGSKCDHPSEKTTPRGRTVPRCEQWVKEEDRQREKRREDYEDYSEVELGDDSRNQVEHDRYYQSSGRARVCAPSLVRKLPALDLRHLARFTARFQSGPPFDDRPAGQHQRRVERIG